MSAPDDRQLLEVLALRARARRQELGLTVREVADAAALSERFVVSLEGGKANPSVVSLARLAGALRTTAPRLLEAETAHPAARRDAALSRPVALVGLRGAGKSTIGAQAAERLGVPFVELDARVAARAGLSAGEIFDQHGAAYYRRLEREALLALLDAGERVVVATGGGLVTDHVTFDRLLSGATVVWLSATPEEHFARVTAQGDTRPMQNRGDAMRELRGILRARRALYERAHHVIDTSKAGLVRSIERLVKIARAELAARG